MDLSLIQQNAALLLFFVAVLIQFVVITFLVLKLLHQQTLLNGIIEILASPQEKKHVNSLESSKSLTKTVEGLEKRLAQLDTDRVKYLRASDLLHFRLFESDKGEESFAAVFLDGEGSGILLSLLRSKTSLKMFGKRIKKGKSLEGALRDEEQKLLTRVLKEI